MNPKLRFLHLPAAIMLTILMGCTQEKELPENSELKRLAERARDVTIIRDDFGIAHVYGKTDADAVFGMLYAQAEDDFNRVERNYIWATGRLAEVDGEAAIFSDLRARLYMTVDEAKAAYDESPKWLKDLCDAYADGLNYYLAKHPEVEPKLIRRFEAWMPMFFSEGSIGGDIEKISVDGIAAFYGIDQPVADMGKADKDKEKKAEKRSDEPVEFTEPKGSNGFAISGALTQSGNTMLLINPHTSFYFRGEIHVVSEEGLNAYGAVTWGQFFVYQGFNENTGWMHTSTRLDFMDDFIEDVFKERGELVYRYGDALRPVKVSEVTLKYKSGNEMLERTFPMYHTHHGPITHRKDGKWVATKLNWDPVNALRQSFTRTKQTGHDGFRVMMDIRSNSSNNTVYADSQGNIAYYHGNFVPRRDPKFDYSQPVDGSNPATDWQGIHAVDEIVTLLNPENGWLQNCNSTPFTAAGKYSPKREGYAYYMAPDSENFRGIHAQRVLSGKSGWTLDKLIEVAYDPYLPGFEQLIPGLVQAYDESGTDYPQLGDAIDILRDWDFKTSTDSVAMSLAHFYGLRYGKEGENALGLTGIDLVNYFGSGSPHDERLRMFSATIAALDADYLQWNTPWGDINRFQRLTGEIQHPHDDSEPSLPVGMASGRWGALASFGAKKYPGTKRIYGSSGNSFVAVVEFGDKVKAKTILAGGQSGNPDSPHFNDQAQRYVDREFKDVAYYRQDVKQHAVRTYHPGDT